MSDMMKKLATAFHNEMLQDGVLALREWFYLFCHDSLVCMTTCE